MRNPVPIMDLADLLRPERAPEQQRGDWAFAPTVDVQDIPGDSPPPSGPLYVNEPGGLTQCLTPLAFPMPDAREDASIDARVRSVRFGFSRVRHAFRRSMEELRELWAGACMAVADEPEGDALGRATCALRRARVLWSFWEWGRADILRAGAIGGAVFIAVATVGASLAATSEMPGSQVTVSAAGTGGEVRRPRTLEQHTRRHGRVRTKATR
jgi:hypothetical protein